MKQAVVMASGPSMTQEDADAVHEWRNNATRETALTCFPRNTLESALA